MAYTTINKSTDYFNTVLYTGNGASTRTVTGVGFKPDLVWAKKRSAVGSHNWMDAVRTANNYIQSNTTAAASNDATKLKSFDSNGFTVGDDGSINSNNATFASWNFKANVQGSSNTAGSINTAYTSANTTAGFSICKWTGSGSNATIGHGLGAVPKIIIVKNLNATQPWWTYSEALGAGKQLRLSGTDAAGNDGGVIWNNTAPTSSVFSVGTNTGSNGSSNNIIAYCFAEKQGYSKFGSYKGNSSTDGTFVYTGFKPAFVVLKRTDGADSWVMLDNKRNEFNPTNKRLLADTNGAETTVHEADFFSNGFKLKQAGGLANGNGNNHIYMAFAEAPLVGTNNVPCTAR